MSSAISPNASGAEESGDLRSTPDNAPTSGVQLTTYVEESETLEHSLPMEMASKIWNGTNPLPDQYLSTVLGRSYEIDQLPWSISAAQFSELVAGGYDVVAELFSKTQIATKIPYYCYIRWKAIKISVKLNATAFHYGALCLSHTIHGGGETHNKAGGFQFLNNHPVLMSATEVPAVDYVIPWPYPFTWLWIDPTTPTVPSISKLAQFYINVAAPLSMVGSLAVDAQLSVFASFVEPEVTLPARLSAGTPPGFVLSRNIKRPRVRKGRTVEVTGQMSMRDKHQEEARSKSSAGIIGGSGNSTSAEDTFKLIQTGESLVQAVAPLFDKPTSLTAQMRVVVAPGTDLSHTRGLDNGFVLGADPEASAALTPGTLSNGVTNPTFQQMFQTPSFYVATSFTDTTSAGSLLTWCFVHPQALVPLNGISGNQTCTPTYLAWYSNPFRYWRGSLRLRYEFFTSTMITCRVRAVWFPPWQTPPASFVPDDTGDFISQVYDITGNTTVEFLVPWVSDTLYRNLDNTNSMGDTGNVWDSNGAIAFYLTNPVTVQDATITPTVYILQFVAAGPDYQVAGYGAQLEPTLLDTNYKLEIINAAPMSKMTRPKPAKGKAVHVTGQCSIFAEFQKPCESLIAAGGFVERGLSCAEEVEDIVSGMKRYTSTSFVTGTGPDYEFKFWNFPSGTVKVMQTHHYLAAPFMYYRGSMRKKVFWNTDVAVYHGEQMPILTGWWNVGYDLSLAGMSSLPRSQMCASDTTQQNLLEWQIPWLSTVPYLLVSGGDWWNPQVESADEAELYTLASLPVWAASPIFAGNFWASVGDDFGLGYLLAPPLINYTTHV
jgi:hypothetical protein